jgi:NADPH:quinone reductase-like Zn-dependent oxidoreductase
MQPGIMILGQELAGEIESVGRKVKRFKKGDQIVAWSGLRLGTYAEYTCLPERGVLFTKPTNMTFEEAATLPVGGLDAVYFLESQYPARKVRSMVQVEDERRCFGCPALRG